MPTRVFMLELRTERQIDSKLVVVMGKNKIKARGIRRIEYLSNTGLLFSWPSSKG